jgi:hypothetical protein
MADEFYDDEPEGLDELEHCSQEQDHCVFDVERFKAQMLENRDDRETRSEPLPGELEALVDAFRAMVRLLPPGPITGMHFCAREGYLALIDRETPPYDGLEVRIAWDGQIGRHALLAAIENRRETLLGFMLRLRILDPVCYLLSRAYIGGFFSEAARQQADLDMTFAVARPTIH